MTKNCYVLFRTLITEKNIPEKHIAKNLDLNLGTVLRWHEKQFVPPQYHFELCKIGKIEIDYSQFNEREKDQFFTPEKTASYCINKTFEILEKEGFDLNKYHFIEPSAGSGSFFNLLPYDRRLGVDIEPRCDGVIKSDFLEWEPPTENNICIGNPPFGMRGQLALKFINHAATFSDFVCFIVPQLFASNGKGSCKSRVKNIYLLHSENIDCDFFYPNGKETKVNVVFQIWSKYHINTSTKPNLNNIIKLYSLSDGDNPGKIRNKKYHNVCDYYLPSTCFGKENMKLYRSFMSLPSQRGYGIKLLSDDDALKHAIENIDWSEAAFKSTNGAHNLRFDIIETSIWNKINGG